MVVTTLLASLCLNANKVFEVDGLWYEEVSMTGGTPGDNEVFVTRIHGKYIYNHTSIRVPSEVEYDGVVYKVAGCDYNVFSYCPNLKELIIDAPIEHLYGIECNECPNLEKLELPSTLKSLGGFGCCPKLVDVKLPAGLERIYSNTFIGSKIRKIVFPEKFRIIEEGAMMYTAIDELEFRGLKFVNEDAFSYLDGSLKVLKFPRTPGAISINYRAFSYNDFEEIWIEDCEDTQYTFGIDYAAFYNTSVKRIFCNSSRVPSLGGPFDSRVMCEQEPYDPSSGEEPWIFPFKNPDKGIMNLADLKAIKLYVSQKCMELYAAHHYWGHFDIEEMDFSAGVAEVPAEATGVFKALAGEGLIEFEAVEDVDINVYDASGRSVAIARLVAGDNRTLSLPAGIYIAVASGHSVKVAVR